MTKLIYADESYQILGACFEVYNDKGCGFAEPVYQECLQIEFTYQRIPFSQKPQLHLFYRDQKLNKEYQPDFVCYDHIIVELKALSKLTDRWYTEQKAAVTH